MPTPARLQRVAAELWVAQRYSPRGTPTEISRRRRGGKIRVGYFSADMHEHATSYLVTGLFEQHDRSAFHTTAFTFGPERRDAMRRRIEAAFDEFIDVSALSDVDVAMLARTREIDIAVDLMGHTRNGRPNIFALRPAPIQVNFLGYPATMGASYIDYLIADPILVPEDSRRDYAEAIAYLPDSYQPNDRSRPISDRAPSRDELGLAHARFVFCCFNNTFKITPEAFASWMRILARVDGSVLWLLGDDEAAIRNLRREASSRGIGADRLVFATLLPFPEHLARHRLADLFLDTWPYNAHTTASDALWAGLPVLTRTSDTFAGRVAASLLGALRMSDLVTTTTDAYERAAIELAVDSAKLADVKKRLVENRRSAPLFDIARFTRHLEAAYALMVERRARGLAPKTLHVRAER